MSHIVSQENFKHYFLFVSPAIPKKAIAPASTIPAVSEITLIAAEILNRVKPLISRTIAKTIATVLSFLPLTIHVR